MELDGRVAIVTGGARGIGASVSRLLSAAGASVMIADLGVALDGTGADGGPAEQLASQLNSAGGRASPASCDVGSYAAVEALFSSTLERFGRLDIVVNVAGIIRDRMIWNMTEAEWDDVIRVHLKGHFNTCSLAARHWRSVNDPNGQFRLINFTSGAGLWGSVGQANYAAAKMGIIGLTNSLALALPRFGVTANVVAPVASTRMTADIPVEHQTFSNDDPELSPDNVAAIVRYLASERSGWCNGRIFETVGYTVRAQSFIDAIGEIRGDGPWSPDELADRVERDLRPAFERNPNPLDRFNAELQRRTGSHA